MTEQLNFKNISLWEVLDKANKSDTPTDVIKSHIKTDSRITTVLGYALNPTFKMGMPTSDPPYIPSLYETGNSPLEILNLSTKLYTMYDKTVKQYKKEEIFIQWLEQLTANEAKLLIAIKDKTISQLFPSLTDQVMCDVLGWPLNTLISLREKHAN